MAADWEISLAERGWVVVDLPEASPIHRARDALLARLRETLPGLPTLDAYHSLVDDDERHLDILFDVARHYWDTQLGRAIIAENFDFFSALLGPDLCIQRCPYLRCVRPGRSDDAAPLHRDTLYGASPYEVSVLVPLTDMSADSAVRAIPGSHLEADAAYPFVQLPETPGMIGSPKHRLGYPYAPRLLDPSLVESAEPVPLGIGQAMIFGLSLVHGGGRNAGERTRFSTDIRIANSLAPVRMSRGVDPEYFVPLSVSAISRSAQRYLAANAARTGGGSE